ncbi:LacI family DNA-binding transcriptional regulator [bacterium]|nr:LacI family DNA-binding transcriptional regulator [bacterium]
MPIINQSEIARKLKVSRATVSKALKGDSDISDEMKQRVRDLADKLNYIPHYHARGLHSRKSMTIGVVVPDISNSFFSYAVDGIMDVAVRSGYHIILAVSREKSEIEKKNILNLLSMRVDGLLIAVSKESPDIQIYQKVKISDVPLIFFDRVLEGQGSGFVGIDDRGAAKKLIDFVIRCGYRNIGHLAGSSLVRIGRDRLSGYLDSLRDHGLPVRREWIVEGGFERKDGISGFEKIWMGRDKPEVVFAANDQIALGAYDAIREKGLKIPDDIGVVAFGHHDFAKIPSPCMTIINVDPYDLGLQAMEMMLQCIRGEKGCEKKVLIDSEIEIGESLKVPGKPEPHA